MNVLIIRRDKLKVHQDFLYIKLYAKKHKVQSNITVYNDSRQVDSIIEYLRKYGADFDMILLDGDIASSTSHAFNPDMLNFLIGPDAVFIRQYVIIRSTSLYCVDKAKHNHLSAVLDSQSWGLSDYVLAASLQTHGAWHQHQGHMGLVSNHF